ncbi:MAG: glycosyltransferase family 2 protein [Armatimonadetes bacterium]|nr:glycosyltransferase family 2 protein [Armatimonadota bacterium]
MRLSIVIVNWNTTLLLVECLESIRAHPPRAANEIVVVDNASGDFNEKVFRERFADVKLIVNPANVGYARANNQAIDVSSGEYILLLNPDTQVAEGALDTLVDFMDDHPNAAACGAKLVRPDGTVERSVRSFPYPAAIAFEFLGLSRLFPHNRVLGRYRMTWFGYDQEIEVDQPMGSCLIIRRAVIDEIGAFDEQFPIFFNEVDWLYRAKQAGYRVYFTPKAVVVHHGAAATSQAGRRRMIRESHDSLARFYAKHFRSRMCGPVYYLIVACIHMGTLLRR